jgi:hypothetical protein
MRDNSKKEAKNIRSDSFYSVASNELPILAVIQPLHVKSNTRHRVQDYMAQTDY